MNSASQHPYHIHWLLVSQLSLKKSLLLICKILELLVNTLATDEKNPVLNRENLTIPWWRCPDEVFNSAWESLPYCLSKHRLKRQFLDSYLTTFLESVTSKIQTLWCLSFFKKCLEINSDLKNSAKNWENIFCFWDNCIWIGILTLSSLRTSCFSLAANL